MAYGQTNVNEGARGGEFLTGDLSYFTIKTIVPCYPTNVKTPLATALKARNWTSLSASRTITVVDGNEADVTYDTDAEYTSAYNKQQNLDTLMAVFATGANPVVVNISAQLIDDPSTANIAFPSTVIGYAANNFGTAYDDDDTGMYTINIVTEKYRSWLVSGTGAGSNADGYQLLAALAGVPVLNTTAATPSGPQDDGAIAITIVGSTFVVNDAANRNTVAIASGTLPKIA